MDNPPPTRKVEVRFTGKAPIRSVRGALGVSDVAAEGPVLRCIVHGSFQPFLEALRGYEVVSLLSTDIESNPKQKEEVT